MRFLPTRSPQFVRWEINEKINYCEHRVCLHWSPNSAKRQLKSKSQTTSLTRTMKSCNQIGRGRLKTQISMHFLFYIIRATKEKSWGKEKREKVVKNREWQECRRRQWRPGRRWLGQWVRKNLRPCPLQRRVAGRSLWLVWAPSCFGSYCICHQNLEQPYL